MYIQEKKINPAVLQQSGYKTRKRKEKGNSF